MGAQQGHVIWLSNSSYTDGPHVQSEARVVTHIQLISVDQLKLVTGGNPALLNANGVMDWAHDHLSLNASGREGCGDDMLLQNRVKCCLLVQEEDVEGDAEGVVNIQGSFGE